jgi:hypothetical protein
VSYLCCWWQVEVAYSQISEIRTAPRAFGLWGDCVIFLKNGDRLVSHTPEPVLRRQHKRLAAQEWLSPLMFCVLGKELLLHGVTSRECVISITLAGKEVYLAYASTS